MLMRGYFRGRSPPFGVLPPPARARSRSARRAQEHGSSVSEKIVVEALFGEVTVLGFIALITFFMIKSGVFETISLIVYHDDSHALHLFEDVHFALFFTMMLYLALVLWVLYVQKRTSAKWKELEEQTRKFLRDNGVEAAETGAIAAKPAARKLLKSKASKVSGRHAGWLAGAGWLALAGWLAGARGWLPADWDAWVERSCWLTGLLPCPPRTPPDRTPALSLSRARACALTLSAARRASTLLSTLLPARPARAPHRAQVKVPALPMPKDEYLEWKYNGGGRIPVGFDGVMFQEDDIDVETLGATMAGAQHKDDQVHKYMMLRARFVWGCANGEGRKNSQVDQKFDFARYLSNSMAETLTQIVIVHEITWVAIAAVIILVYGLFAGAHDAASCVIMTLLGFCLVASMLYLNFTVRRIQTQLSPRETSNLRQVMTGHNDAMPFYDSLEAKKGMSKHEQLFPLGAHGPHFLQHWLRTTLLLAAVYVVGLGVVFARVMFDSGLQYLLPVCLLSALITVGMVWPILPRITIITSVAMLKRVKLIELTIREVRLERSLNTIKILAALQSQLRKIHKLQGQPRKDVKNRREISPKHKSDLLDAFRLFDKDNSNSIDSKELFNLLQDLGQQVEQADAERLILEMDSGVRAHPGATAVASHRALPLPVRHLTAPHARATPPHPAQGNGEVSFEEFCEVMADDDDAPPENGAEIAHDMFKMLDKDNSGEISLGEFRAFLVKLPMDIEDDAIDAMLNDIFGDDDDAAINVHEFEHFLTSSSN
jgi:Ca2+-binding EF-hand superfamily protein